MKLDIYGDITAQALGVDRILIVIYNCGTQVIELVERFIASVISQFNSIISL